MSLQIRLDSLTWSPLALSGTRKEASSNMVYRAFLKGVLLAALQQWVGAVTITDIQGASFLSPLRGEAVHNLTGIVTAKVRRTLAFRFIVHTLMGRFRIHARARSVRSCIRTVDGFGFLDPRRTLKKRPRLARPPDLHDLEDRPCASHRRG